MEYLFWRFEKQIALSEKKSPLGPALSCDTYKFRDKEVDFDFNTNKTNFAFFIPVSEPAIDLALQVWACKNSPPIKVLKLAKSPYRKGYKIRFIFGSIVKNWASF